MQKWGDAVLMKRSISLIRTRQPRCSLWERGMIIRYSLFTLNYKLNFSGWHVCVERFYDEHVLPNTVLTN